MTRKTLGGAFVIASVLFGAYVLFTYYGQQKKPLLEQSSVRLAWLHQVEHAGFYTAKEKGFYTAQGLDVRLEPGGREVQGIEAVLSGSEVFGVDSADQVLLAREKGQDVVAIGVVFRKSPVVLFAKKSSGIKTPYDFVGRSVGRKPGDAQDTAYLVMLKKLGIDRSKINEQEIKYDMAPFFNDEVEVWNGFALDEPIAAEEAGYPVNVIHPDDYGIHVYADVIVAKGETIRTRPDLVEKFLRASLQGWEYAVKHPSEAVNFTVKADPSLKAAKEAKGMEAIIPLIDTGTGHIGWMDPKIWEEIQGMLVDYKFLKSPIDVQQAYDMSFLEKIYNVSE